MTHTKKRHDIGMSDSSQRPQLPEKCDGFNLTLNPDTFHSNSLAAICAEVGGPKTALANYIFFGNLQRAQ